MKLLLAYPFLSQTMRPHGALIALLVAGACASDPALEPDADPRTSSDPPQRADSSASDPHRALAVAAPVPAPIGLVLSEVVTFPKTTPTPAPTDTRLMRRARINHLGELPDGSGRLFVPDLNGPLYLLRGGVPRVYADLSDVFAPHFHSGRGMGSGFGFVAFHPAFGQNGKLYTVHTEAAGPNARPTTYPTQPNTTLQGVVTEWTATDPRADTFRGTRREILRLGFATLVHGIQQIAFNPTAKPGDEDYGLLYLGIGDGGIGVTSDIPQDLSTPAGKILRIDPLGRDAKSGTYGIPARNPFVGKTRALPEIYALGMRDPHRFSWDAGGRHQLFLGHIGEHAIEAVYDVRAGDNLGWSRREGAGVFRASDRCSLAPLPGDDRTLGYVYPVAAYEHRPPRGWNCSSDLGYAIAGGFVARDPALPALEGKYLFGDLVNGRVYYADVDAMRRGGPAATVHAVPLFTVGGVERTMAAFADSPRVDLRWGTDRTNAIYLLSKANGKIWKVVATRRVDLAQLQDDAPSAPTTAAPDAAAPSPIVHAEGSTAECAGAWNASVTQEPDGDAFNVVLTRPPVAPLTFDATTSRHFADMNCGVVVYTETTHSYAITSFASEQQIKVDPGVVLTTSLDVRLVGMPVGPDDSKQHVINGPFDGSFRAKHEPEKSAQAWSLCNNYDVFSLAVRPGLRRTKLASTGSVSLSAEGKAQLFLRLAKRDCLSTR